MIEFDFSFETLAGAVDASPRWSLAPGSSSGLTFRGAANSLYVGCNSGNFRVLAAAGPDRLNERAEIFYGARYPDVVLGDNPVAHWRLGEKTGTAAKDSSANQLTGTYRDLGYSLDQAGAIAGDLDGAVLFNGTSGHVGVNDDTRLRLNHFTLEAWVYATSLAGNKVIMCKGDAPALFFNFYLDVNSSGNPRIILTSGGTPAGLTSTAAITTNTWYYVVATYDGSNLKLYVNGAAAGSSAYGSLPDTGNDEFLIGRQANIASPLWWPGRIDEVAVYNVALSASAIARHYAMGSAVFPGSTCRTGVILRHVDVDNYVYLRANHVGTKVAELVERVAGVETTLLTLPFAGPASGFGSIRLELIGARARAWYESGSTTVHDRPPDGAATLSKDYDNTLTYGWGMYMHSDTASNAMQISAFTACGLPGAVLPPPMLNVVSAAALYNFSAVTLTANNLGPAVQIEWEIFPVDTGDFPEPYRDVGDGALTSRVFFIRTGYAYDVRARAVSGTPGPWTDYTRVGPIGSPGGSGWTSQAWQETNWPSQAYGTPSDVSPVVADDNFPAVLPDYALQGTAASSAMSVKGTTGQDHFTDKEVRPRRTFKLGFQHRTKDEYQLLIKFFDYMQGKNKPFNWTHPTTGEQFVMRFDTDDYTATYQDQNVVSPIAEISFSFIESPINVVPTFAFRLLADSSL